MKLILALSLILAAPVFAEESATPTTPVDNGAQQTLSSWEQPGFVCSTQCANSSCGRVCSTQQRCQTYCSPSGDAACYCFL